MKTSVGLDQKTYDDLARIARKNGRNLIGQIRYWISKEAKK